MVPSLQSWAWMSTRTSPSTSVALHCGSVEHRPQASRNWMTKVWSGWTVAGRQALPTSGWRSMQVALLHRNETAATRARIARAGRHERTDRLYTGAKSRER